MAEDRQEGRAGAASVTYAEALELALCFGWIDGQKRGLDETPLPAALHAAPPRAARWSKINREKAEALIAAGRDAAGRAGRGRGGARPTAAGTRPTTGQRTATVPDDLRASSTPTRPRAEFFADARQRRTATRSSTGCDDAKKPETRERPRYASSSPCSSAARSSTASPVRSSDCGLATLAARA